MKDIPLVIPALLLSAGILFYTAVQASIVGFARHRVPQYLSFALSCVCYGMVQLGLIVYYATPTLADAVLAARMTDVFGVLSLPCFFAFVAYYTRQQHALDRWMMALTLFAGALALFSIVAPYGLRFSQLRIDGVHTLVWGGSVPRFRGELSYWNLPVRALFLTVFLWAARCAWQQYRRGFHRAALFLGIYLVMAIAGTFIGALVDMGAPIVYTMGFAPVMMALLLSVSMALDIRERTAALKNTAEELRRMANEDFLTGLPNRAAWHAWLTQALAEAQRDGKYGAMLLIDLDHFKTINDALGHDVGDELLRKFGQRLRQEVGVRGFVARLGGDEFVAVLPARFVDERSAAAGAGHLAAEIGRALLQPFTIGARVLRTGASTGIALFPGAAASDLDVLRHADMALHRAKRMGRDAIQFFVPKLQAAADERMWLEKGLHEALEKGQLDLHFQPLVDRAGRMLGAETLVRWQHPERGMISPSLFVPIAEETGLIHEIGEWVLHHACERFATWLQEGQPFRGYLSVNVSPWQFVRPDFTVQVGRALAESRIDPERLMLEVIESALLYDQDETVGKLNTIRRMGIRVALDDFGTGYSSLAHVRDLPLDLLKIDQSFVRQLARNADNPMVGTIIDMGRHMRLRVVAEGVENDAQRNALARLNCDGFQGYLFSPPLAEPEFLEWLGRHDARAAQA